MGRKGWYLVGLLLGLVGLWYTSRPDGRTRIIACDVGQGDAILVTRGTTQVLIDGGPSSAKVLACLADQLPFYDRRIELIVLTNTDFDHLNGLSAVLERYTVMQFVTADGVHESAALDHLVAALDARQLPVRMVSRGDTLQILGPYPLTFRVVWPPATQEKYAAVFQANLAAATREQLLSESAKRGNLNERSVVLLFLQDTYTALLMGDAGDQAEKQLVADGTLPTVDYLKVGHHGSKYASTLEFLEMIRPRRAVISVGKGNRYGHPTAEALSRLTAVGAEIVRTDEVGTVVMTLDQ